VSLPAAPRTISPAAGHRLLTASNGEDASSGAERSHGAAGAAPGTATPGFNLAGGLVPHQGLSPLLQIFMLLLQFSLTSFLKNLSRVTQFNPANDDFRQNSSLLLSAQRY